MATRYIKYGKRGLAENPVGMQVTWNIKDKIYIVDVIGVERRFDGAYMLKTRYFNGECGPDVCAAAVKVLIREYQDNDGNWS